jgi:hypothetical protein
MNINKSTEAETNLLRESETYEGAWFQIRYPEGYRIVPSLKSLSADGYDSVFFVAPDESIRLYVCSPQWNRATSDISIQPSPDEELISNDVIDSAQEPVEAIHTLIKSIDGQRVRYYERTEANDGQIGWTVGIEAPSTLDYRDILSQFKYTLTQYAD